MHMHTNSEPQVSHHYYLVHICMYLAVERHPFLSKMYSQAETLVARRLVKVSKVYRSGVT